MNMTLHFTRDEVAFTLGVEGEHAYFELDSHGVKFPCNTTGQITFEADGEQIRSAIEPSVGNLGLFHFRLKGHSWDYSKTMCILHSSKEGSVHPDEIDPNKAYRVVCLFDCGYVYIFNV